MNYFPKSVFLLLSLVVGNSHAEQGHAMVVEKLEASVELMAKFHSWTEEHAKSYDTHDEKLKRLQIWIENDGRLCCVFIGKM